MRPLTDLGLKLGVEGSVGTDIPYLGYTEANLKLPTANKYNSDQLFLVLEQCTMFGDQVPIQVGTTFQDEILTALPIQDLVGLVKEIKKGIECRIVSQAAQLSVEEIGKEIAKELEKAKEEVGWDLASLKGKIKLMKAVTIPAKGELQVTGVTTIRGYTKRCHVIVKPYGEKQGKHQVTPVYIDLKPGSSKVKIHVMNNSNKPVQLPTKMVIGIVSAANVVSAMIAPRNMLEEGWDQPPNETLETEKQKAGELVQRGKLVIEK